jgi:uncharacterized protein
MPEQQEPQRKKPKQSTRPRHVPQRTCIVCRQVRPKRELIRVVRTPTGRIELDPTGKKSGRGAYLCARRSCWEPALHQGRLEREFGMAIPAEDLPALEAYLDSLPAEATPPPAKRPARQRAKPASDAE